MRMLFLAPLLLIAGCSSQIEGGDLPTVQKTVPSEEITVTLIYLGEEKWEDLAGHPTTLNDISNILSKGRKIKVCPDFTLKMCGGMQKISFIAKK